MKATTHWHRRKGIAELNLARAVLNQAVSDMQNRGNTGGLCTLNSGGHTPFGKLNSRDMIRASAERWFLSDQSYPFSFRWVCDALKLNVEATREEINKGRQKMGELLESVPVRCKPTIPVRHGTISTYVAKSCRCDECRKANTEYNYRRRHPLNTVRNGVTES